MLATFHPDSPALETTRTSVAQLFEDYDIDVEIIHFAYIGSDGEVATCRVRQKTVAPEDSRFRDNIVDAVYVLRLYEKEWRIWSTVAIEAKAMK